jgi:transcriptional regulator with XRE-family HTH domain
MGEKLRMIRESVGDSRAAFGKRLGFDGTLITNIEQGKQRVREDVIEAIDREMPEYVYWLVTGKTDP